MSYVASSSSVLEDGGLTPPSIVNLFFVGCCFLTFIS